MPLSEVLHLLYCLQMMYRNPVKVLLLSIFTVGLYIIYWLFTTSREMAKRNIKLPSVWLFALPFVVNIGLIVLTSAVSAFLNENGSTYHFVNLVLFPIVTIAFIFAVLPLSIWWFWKYCGGIQVVTNGRLAQGSSFGLWFLLSLFGAGVVWPMIIQNYFNSERLSQN